MGNATGVRIDSVPAVAVDGLVKRYGKSTVVDNVSFKVAPGELVTLLGPSGCGKTTTLRMIAGLTRPDGGRIRMSGEDVTCVPTHKRNVGFVFQNYALFPHMTVNENVAFGLKMRRVGRAELQARVERALRLVKLEGYGDRHPRQLSGGQQQRVALARALVTEPTILLLDEPLSNLDAKLRRGMRVEIRQLLTQLRITAVYVTHDQEEALVISDRILVMDRGVVRQEGTPAEIYHTPANEFVAGFIGETNVLRGRVAESMGGGLLKVSTSTGLVEGRGEARVDQAVSCLIRPERVRILPPGQSGQILPATLESVEYRGPLRQYTCRLVDGVCFVALSLEDGLAEGIAAGSAVGLHWTPEACRIVPEDNS